MKKNNTMLEVSKETRLKFQISKMAYQVKIKKKITNDEYILELIK